MHAIYTNSCLDYAANICNVATVLRNKALRGKIRICLLN